MEIRERIASDLPDCLTLAQVVHAADGYPPYLGDGLEAFIEVKTALGIWVALVDGVVVGHVALNEWSSQEVLDLATLALDSSVERIGVVARLLVSPGIRRMGVGRALLDRATHESRARNRRPVLDVATHFVGAIALYEKCGWTRIGMVTVRMPDDSLLDEYVYVSP